MDYTKRSDLDDYALPPVTVPYLPPQSSPRYTLVLDLDETLIHYIDNNQDPALSQSFGESVIGTFLIRPGAQQFLVEMAKHYEVVIFTAAMQDVIPFSIKLSSMPIGSWIN
jgi:TFIIF-interacting CTD phosphatase-like protein